MGSKDWPLGKRKQRCEVRQDSNQEETGRPTLTGKPIQPIHTAYVGGVAQLVEQQNHKLSITGSNPVAATLTITTYKEQNMTCIFVTPIPYCEICLDSRKLQCLIDHQHMVVSQEGKNELRHILEDSMNSPNRYKTVSGNEQRKGG